MDKQPVKGAEHVLLCERGWIQDIMGDDVLMPISRKLLASFADPSAFWFGPRHIIEADAKYVQLVSYVIIEHDSRILCYQRGNDSQEQRLKNKLSIGLGGHISLQDAKVTNGTLDIVKTIKAGAAREVREELEVHKVVARKKLVLLHSKLNAVDEVHWGFVEVWKIDSSQVGTKEKGLRTIGFQSLPELSDIQGFESWSTLLIQYLNNMNPNSQ